MLEDRGVLQRDGGRLRLEEGAELPMPESVQGIIAARLDALPPGEKALLQDAAVVGKVVWLGALAAVSGRPRAEVEERLHALERKEFVRRERRSSVATETQYAFRHVLVRDVAYSQIPRGRARRQAPAASRSGSSRSPPAAPTTSPRCSRTTTSQALEFARASGGQQTSSGRSPERAARAARRRRPRVRAERLRSRRSASTARRSSSGRRTTPSGRSSCSGSGRARYDVDGGGARAVRARRSRALLAQGKLELAAEAEVGLSNIAWLGGDRDDAFLHIEAARALVEAMPPSRAKAEVLSQHSRHLMLAERDEEAIEVAREALAMAEALGLDEIRAHALDNLGCARCNAGDLTGLRDLERSIAIASELNSPEAIRGHTNLATQYAILGDLRRAAEVVEQGIALGPEAEPATDGAVHVARGAAQPLPRRPLAGGAHADRRAPRRVGGGYAALPRLAEPLSAGAHAPGPR